MPKMFSDSDPEEIDATHRRFLPRNMSESAGGKHGVSSDSNMTSRDGTDVEGDADNNFIKSEPDRSTYGAVKTTEEVVSGTEAKENKFADGFLNEEHFGFDCKFVKRFYRLHGVLFLSICSASTSLFLFLLILVLLQEYIIYQVGLIASGFYKVLGDKDLDGFWLQTLKSLGFILAVSFVKSTTQYVQKVLTVTFRKILCQASHRLYFADIRFYQLNTLDRAIDNPDQRMTQDIEKFCTTYCEVLPKLMVSPFTIGYYCYQGYLRSGWEGPVGCFGFFLLATSVNRLLMSPIVNYVVKQEKCEGDFRFLHMLVRVHSESIAFQHASLVEQRKVEDSLDKLIDTQHSLYWRQYLLSFFVNLVDYVGSIFSYLMLAIPIFSGRYNHLTPAELGALISQNAFILIYLIYTFTSLVDLSGKFASVAGVTHRISQLLERLNALEDFWKELFPDDQNRHPDTRNFEKWIQKRQTIQQRLYTYNGTAQIEAYVEIENDSDVSNQNPRKLLVWSLEDITFSPPGVGEPLISNLNLELVVGESLLISGTSSAGKSSILRILRGLWPYSSGNMQRYYPPGPHGVYFCPQKSYLTWGTLRQQISFPLLPDTANLDDKVIIYYLDKLRLMPVVERVGGLDVFCSWNVFDSLSPGETQRLCLLRVFYHQPVVVVLDEVTSALPLDIEDFVYSELKRLGITLISVGHRESIRKYHDKQLIVNSKGGWAIYPIIHE